MDTLKLASPDQSEVLDQIGCVSAQEASELCFRRPDWGIFVAMFGCLWKEAFRRYDSDKVLAVVACEEFGKAAEAYYRRWGFCPHPCKVLEMCGLG